jgi:hypothetical protein
LKSNVDSRRGRSLWAVAAVTLFLVLAVCTYAQWDPINAVRIGEAPVPGPDGNASESKTRGLPAKQAALLGITTRNVHGIMSNLMVTLRSGTNVICVQDADIAEANVRDITAQAAATGYTATWGEPTALSKDWVTTRGRRTAIIVKDMRCQDISMNHDAATQFLKDSGRWVKRMIPVGNGKAI